jgi:hypothetical protein
MTKFRITTPLAGFTGVSAGVNFTNGVAEIDAPGDAQHEDARRVAYFTAAGYGVEEIADEPSEEDVVEEPPTVTPPAKSASKADWLVYAVDHRGADPVEADKLTRDQLAAQYGPKGEDQ